MNWLKYGAVALVGVLVLAVAALATWEPFFAQTAARAPVGTSTAEIIRDEWDLPVTRDKLWENLFIDHIDELHMVARPYPASCAP